MAKRKQKETKGKHKEELRNLPIKGLISSHHQEIINQQIAEQNITQSEFLRNLLLNPTPVRRKRTPKKRTPKSSRLTESIIKIGQKLNRIAHSTNTSHLAENTIQLGNDAEVILKKIENKLNVVLDEAEQIVKEKKTENNIQIKILVTPSELEIIEKIATAKKITKCRHLRQQITGYKEIKHKNKAKELCGQLSKISNNVNQIQEVIDVEEKTSKLVIIQKETELQLKYIQEQIDNILDNLVIK